MARLGIAVSRTELRGVLVRRTRITWHGHVELAIGESIRDGLGRLLAHAPLRAIRPRTTVAVGAGQCQLKQIEGLPPVTHARMSSKIVRENSASFFLRMGSRIVVSDVDLRANRTAWAAAFDADVADEVLAGLRLRRISRPHIVPFAAAIAPQLTSGTHRVVDDDLLVELTTIDKGRITAIRRMPGRVRCDGPTVLSSTAAALAKPGLEFLSAYGAAIAGGSGPFVWRPAPDASRTRLLDRLRVAAAVLLLATTASAALIAPGVHAQRTMAQASADLSAARGAQLEAARVEGALRRVTGQLERIQQFGSARGQMTLLLGALTQALPDSTALLTLRIDSLEGSFVALTPHAADILPQLAEVDAIVLAKIVGSVTRELQGSAHVERATVRFRRRRQTTLNAPPPRKELK